jgi:ATP-dependent DNA helicase RecG
VNDVLSTPLQFLKGVGPRKAADLKRAGLITVEDLLYRLPFRYEDRSKMQPIASLRPGNKAAVLGDIKSAHLATTRRRGFKIFHAVVGDTSGAIRCTWMNQAFLQDILQPHLKVVIFGDVKLDSTGLHFMNPEYELVGEDLEAVHTARIVPFYEKTGTVTPNMQRKLVRQALDQLPATVPDALPAEMRDRLRLVPRRVAMEESHFPPNEASVEELNGFRTMPQRRLIFEEFFLFQIGHAWRRHATSSE